MLNDLKLEELKEIKKLLDNLGVKFFVVFGTLLGIYRDKAFLEGDPDIDIGIFGEERNQEVRTAIQEAGFKIRQASPRYLRHLSVEKRTLTDIHFFSEEGNSYQCYVKTGKPCVAFPSKFGKLEKVKFRGMSFFAPSPIEDFLRWCYGDWRDRSNKVSIKRYRRLSPDSY